MAQKRQTPEQYIRSTLQVLDKDGKGIIPLKELESNLSTIGDTLKPHEISEIFNDLDIDDNGNVNYDGMSYCIIYIIYLYYMISSIS